MDILKIAFSLFAVIDPFGLIPIYVSLTSEMTKRQRQKTIQTAVVVATGVLLVVTLFGNSILELFGISLSAFRIAGGLLLILIAIDMLNARPSSIRQTEGEREEASTSENIGVVPLAIPLLAGPGAISALIVYSEQTSGEVERFMLGVIAAVMMLITYGVLLLGDKIGAILGKTGLNIAKRLMGMIVAAVGAEFIMQGIVDYL